MYSVQGEEGFKYKSKSRREFMKRTRKVRVCSLFLSAFILVSSVTACTKQNVKTATVSSIEYVTGENTLQAANANVSNNIELLDTQKEAEDVESQYDYAKEIQFWKPEQKFEIASKVELNMSKVDGNVPAVRFFLDNKLSIEISTKYNHEVKDDNQKYTIYPDINAMNAVSRSYIYGEDDNGDSKLTAKNTVRLRGGKVGWSSGDIIYMLQNIDFETGEKLTRPLVTTIVIDREEREALTPEYYVNENGELYVQWDPVEGADAYALVSYYKMPDQDRLDEIIKENNKKADEHEKEVAADDPLVINQLAMADRDEDGKEYNGDIFLWSDSRGDIIDVIADTKYSLKDSKFYDEYVKKDSEAGNLTSLPNIIRTSILPESYRYLLVVALKKGTGVDESEPDLNNVIDEEFEELLKKLEEDGGEIKEPEYYAIVESPLYDFNYLAGKIPSYIKKYESEHPSTSHFTVDKVEDIAGFIYVRMVDGSIRKYNLEYMDDYAIESKDLIKDGLQEVISVKVKVKNTPFYFHYNIKEFDKDDPNKTIDFLKNTFEDAIKFKADMLEYPPKAPIVKINKDNKTISFMSDGEKKFYNASMGKGGESTQREESIETLLNESSQLKGGISEYNDTEVKECLPENVLACNKMTEDIAWAMTTGQKQLVLHYNTDESEIMDSIYEAGWQNQYILENDFPRFMITKQNNGSYLIDFFYLISDLNQRKSMQKAMKSKVQSILNSFKNSENLELLYNVNNYICDNVEYDQYIIDNGTGNSTSRTAYGPLIEGKAVCSGYSRAVQLIMSTADYKCYVDGGNSKYGLHAWNILSTKDGFYMVDSTWNDSDVKNLYLMVPKEIYLSDHESDGRCIKNLRRTVKYASYGGEYDYLSFIGKAVTLTDLDDALYAYGTLGYCPNWLRVYNFDGRSSSLDPYVGSAADSLTSKYRKVILYNLSWSDSKKSFLYINSPDLKVTDMCYGKPIN